MSPNPTPTEEMQSQDSDAIAEELINKYAGGVAEDRVAQWKAAIKEELRELIESAAELHKKITEAKTNYKKQFYGKKFQKKSTQIKQMVTALNRLEENTKEQQEK